MQTSPPVCPCLLCRHPAHGDCLLARAAGEAAPRRTRLAAPRCGHGRCPQAAGWLGHQHSQQLHVGMLRVGLCFKQLCAGCGSSRSFCCGLPSGKVLISTMLQSAHGEVGVTGQAVQRATKRGRWCAAFACVAVVHYNRRLLILRVAGTCGPGCPMASATTLSFAPSWCSRLALRSRQAAASGRAALALCALPLCSQRQCSGRQQRALQAFFSNGRKQEAAELTIHVVTPRTCLDRAYELHALLNWHSPFIPCDPCRP